MSVNTTQQLCCEGHGAFPQLTTENIRHTSNFAGFAYFRSRCLYIVSDNISGLQFGL